jgi:hypothetical protein
VGTIKSRVNRARNRLGDMFGPAESEGDESSETLGVTKTA